jgi:putative hemolysin
VLRLAGMRSSKEGKEAADVSEDMLRMVVDEAQRSDTGIDTGEGRMIKAVLDMQDKAVGKIMKPRVDIVGVPLSATASDILKIVVENRYSRIPVYRGDVDNVVGIVYSKDLLDAFSKTLVNEDQPMDIDTSAARGGPASGAEETVNWGTLTAEQIMGPTYFIPETMTAWAALQEMRKRRMHMAIVVDEYGGTAGLVTFEDILEEVVGEIYDEDDDEDDIREKVRIV